MKRTTRSRQRRRSARVRSNGRSVVNKGSDHVGKTIEDILRLESIDKTLAEIIADRIAGFTGSITFVWLHVAWFALWILINVPWFGWQPFDPYPFTFLTMIVSLEAIFLATFILMAENRQARLADRRARVDLQVNMIAEREVTKLMELMVDIHNHLGIRKTDRELDSMQEPTNIEHLTEAAQTAEDKNNGGSRSEKVKQE
ncbi:MAG: DUF1003 domain-containing protein [Candidatus Binatia bacterium]